MIASTQIKDFFGLRIDKVPGEFLPRIQTLIQKAGTFSAEQTMVAVASLAVIVACMRFAPKLPGAIVVLFGATLVQTLLQLPVETIGTRFGGIPSGLPHIQFPAFRGSLIFTLLSPAITVAMLGAIESLLSAVVADRMTNDRHNPNTELFGQGIANIVSPMFGGLPATGAIARDYHGMPLALEAALQDKDIVLIIFYIQDFHARTSLTFACWPRSIDRGSIRPSSRSSSPSSEAFFRITRSTYPFNRF